MALRLLVVEDDDSIRTALRWALEDEGYDVAEAVSGEEAVRAVAVAAPDLMVVDLMLGSMDGYAVIREVRRGHDLPIIVVSARADTHDIVAALEAGADDYVTKPFEVPRRSPPGYGRCAAGPAAAPPSGRPRRSCSTPTRSRRWCSTRAAAPCTGARSSCR
ncbi:response regulator [Blastococcus sp. TML/M2B]|uniref:response regulator transcription factor n=1 Tax=Blastococcus sp. TML/M2B TaxID=2798727 RepID=UPI002814BBD2|nr:response regulator [Blastococcus sp. TML/M2B]